MPCELQFMKNVRRKKNRRRPESFPDSERSRENGVTKLTPHDDYELDGYKKRALHASFVLIFFFAVIVSRLWYLQIHKGECYKKLADTNRVRSLKVTAPRGNIYDRFGREIVTNRPSFNVVWVREDNKVDDDWLKRVTRILKIDISELLEKIRKMAHTQGHIPIRLAADVDWETVARVENNRMELPGIKIEVAPLRVYHWGNLASHMIGYLGEVSQKELDADKADIYRRGDMIGKMGLERLREKDLRGEKGLHSMEVNSLGFEQRNLKGLEPLPGNDLYLTVDMELQKAAEDIMEKEDRAGAVVALDPNSGRLLVLASSPALHLDDFVGGISIKAWKAMLDNPHNPLLNKLVQGQYPPGSTYKPVTALAGLAERVVSPETVFYCPGYYRVGNRTYRCWKRGGHGAVNLQRALSESCDVYFYQVGQRLGVDRLAKYARLFGLGQRTGIEMEHEKPGLIPTADWKKRHHGQKWQEGETLSVAIGQGFNLATPVQLALMTAAIANGGTLYKPTLIEEVKDPDGRVLESFKPHILHRLTGQSRNLKLVRDGMVEAVNGRRGTGRRARVSDKSIVVGGKTGTAQVVRVKQYKHLKEEDIPYKFRDHALFVCFAPAVNPEIVVAVVVEHGLHGGSAAAPVAGAVLEQYFASKAKRGKVATVVLDDSAPGTSQLMRQDISGGVPRHQSSQLP
ncbi:MAG: penicillin-binding protein 2 [Desulfobulbus propionicus]|nr:MAG: penicillin-binding protein 2 [Desulfobulbus propionicus]